MDGRTLVLFYVLGGHVTYIQKWLAKAISHVLVTCTILALEATGLYFRQRLWSLQLALSDEALQAEEKLCSVDINVISGLEL